MLHNDNVLFRFHGPFGIEVQIGSSMLWLAGLLVISSMNSINQLGSALIWIAMLIGSIFLHELGHGWACHVQRVPVRRIMLHGGGGFCERARSASVRQVEFITAMGPIVNLTIWAVTSLLAWYFTPSWRLGGVYTPAPKWVYWLDFAAQINILLFFFNMLPVQPLDGGKLLQLGLRRILPSGTASRLTGWIGFIFALLWFPIAIYMFFTLGWVLFFFPSIRMHWHMAKGRIAA